MTTFQMRYRLKDYQLADAFRPQPGWGYKGFTVESDEVGTDDINDIYAMALNSPPDDRYELFSVRALPYCDENPIMFGPAADRIKFKWPESAQSTEGAKG